MDHSSEAIDILTAIREEPVEVKAMTEHVHKDGMIALVMWIKVGDRDIGIWTPEHSREPHWVHRKGEAA